MHDRIRDIYEFDWKCPHGRYVHMMMSGFAFRQIPAEDFDRAMQQIVHCDVDCKKEVEEDWNDEIEE